MMKTLSSYIDNMLGALSTRFPSAIIRYAFMAEEELHVVDLMGNDIESLAKVEWADMYNQWVDEFERTFSGEYLLLAREGDSVRVSAEEATKHVTPKTLADTLPNSGSISYTWAETFADYVYEVQGVLRVLIPASNKDAPSRRRGNSKRDRQASESTFTFDSVLTSAGTESFCMS